MTTEQDFANNLFLFMEETFEAKHHGIYLDKGTSLLETLEYEMLDFFRIALIENNLMDAYRSRPPYQQNDYIGSLCVNAQSSKSRNKNGWIRCWTN